MNKTEIIKGVLLAIILVVATLSYTYFMLYWSDTSLPIIEHFKPSNKYTVNALLIFLNMLGVVVLSIILSFPLNYIFGRKGYMVALSAAVAIVVWNIITWAMYIPQMPGHLTIIEWVSVIVILPSVAAVAYKVMPANGGFKRA